MCGMILDGSLPMTSSDHKNRTTQQSRYHEEGEAMVAAWESSGLSMAAFARQEGINVRRLGLWRRRLKGSVGDTDHTSGFVPVSVTAPGSLDVIIDEHIRIRVSSETDLGLLRATVSALRC